MLTYGKRASWLNTIWNALGEWQDAYEGRNAVGGETFEDRYDDICTAMAWIAEELDVEMED